MNYDELNIALGGTQALTDWCNLYRSFGVTIDYTTLNVPPRPEGHYLPVLNAQEVLPDETNEFFKRMLYWHGIMPFTAPVRRGGVVDIYQRLTFSNLIGENTRDAQTGSYVYWAKDHILKLRKDGSLKRTYCDNSLTVEEAMLYHLFQLRRYGLAYLTAQHSDIHFCTGSRGRHTLRFDLQDIKICLD